MSDQREELLCKLNGQLNGIGDDEGDEPDYALLEVPDKVRTTNEELKKVGIE